MARGQMSTLTWPLFAALDGSDPPPRHGTMRRRCAAHDQWMRAHPDATAFSEAWADRNLDELAQR